MSVKIFGIRHHGPGSSRSMLKALNEWQPDVILIEGPPDAESILSLVSDEKMKPPVALLAYRPDKPENASFYPFAEFSPEWQAMLFAHKHTLPVHFMDLPLKHRFAILEQQQKEEKQQGLETEESLPLQKDPFSHFAHIAGFDDSELWWEYMFEQTENPVEIFSALQEAIHELRILPAGEDKQTMLREAYMRKIIRQQQKKYNNIAIICGAWHAPAIEDLLIRGKKQDTELLKKLPAVKKISATWVPWTFDRLTFQSGYGAGLQSPGWYSHLWKYRKNITPYWMVKVARAFRKENMDISSAHIIEAVRLVDALCTIRNLARPTLNELNEATTSVLCFGESLPLKLIQKELIVGKKMGSVADNTPKVPLQFDLEQWQKKYRLKMDTEAKMIELDLRQPTGLGKSVLLHRLKILGIQWGKIRQNSGKGTFKEVWSISWSPELMIQVIDRAIWGNTVKEAATNFMLSHLTDESLARITRLFADSLTADIAMASRRLIEKIDELSAQASDILELMDALNALADATYGDVRNTDTDLILAIMDRLITRISISLPHSCMGLDEDSAAELLVKMELTDRTVAKTNQEEQKRLWYEALVHISSNDSLNGMIAGKVCRILYEREQMEKEQLDNQFMTAISTANEMNYCASWLEGFLQGGGIQLVLDRDIWNLLDSWVANLEQEQFSLTLPLLRRAFANFNTVDKDRIGRRAGGKDISVVDEEESGGFDEKQAQKPLSLLKKILAI